MDIKDYTFDYRGYKHAMRQPRGKVLAVGCDGIVYLEKQKRSKRFVVVYGLQVKEFDSLLEGITDFTHCVSHYEELSK